MVSMTQINMYSLRQHIKCRDLMAKSHLRLEAMAGHGEHALARLQPEYRPHWRCLPAVDPAQHEGSSIVLLCPSCGTSCICLQYLVRQSVRTMADTSWFQDLNLVQSCWPCGRPTAALSAGTCHISQQQVAQAESLRRWSSYMHT